MAGKCEYRRKQDKEKYEDKRMSGRANKNEGNYRYDTDIENVEE
jgi:hypothetical protein